ncbi:MAG: ABC transporter ATP-binding protein [Candidatus Bruticola sp.]
MPDFKNQSELQIFLSYFKPHKKLFFLDMSCALAISIIDLAFPAVSRWCLYTLLPQQAWRTFWLVMAIITVAYVLRSIFTYTVSYWGHRFGILVENDIRRDLFCHIQKLSYDFFDNNRVGSLMSRLTADLFEITELAHHGPEDIFISTLTIVGSLIMMFIIEWRLALVIAVMLPIFMLVVRHFRLAMRDASRRVKKVTATINADFESGLSGIRTAKAFANENIELLKFDSANRHYRRSKYQFHKAMGRFNAVMDFCVCMLSVAVIAAGGALIMADKLNLIDLITFSLYITTFVTPVRRLAFTATELLANGTAGLHRFVELMRTEPTLKDDPQAQKLANVKGQIDIKNVSFAYKEGVEVLHNISLSIKPGETIAFVGSSGGGKTTLSQLIPRFYDVKQGSICIDGHDVRSVTQESLHQNIGVVSQDIFLFADSILENIRYGKLEASEAEVIKAAQLAEIYEDIAAMPEGLQSNAGERGTLLSGGQKQRISIARIFLKNPPILILDEATSALDSVTEAKIQRTFDKLSAGRTTIVIAHRLSTVKNADRIAVIEEGRLIEIGTHQELLSRGGAYASLVQTQELKD